MMHRVQLAIMDLAYEAALRETLVHSGPWHVESVASPDPGEECVLVMDEESFNRIPLPLPYPERVVLITRKDPENLSHAWDAGIVSVVSANDPPNTVLLAIMAAALRIPKAHAAVSLSGISPSKSASAAQISPETRPADGKRCKTH
jgi:hypothetical protein